MLISSADPAPLFSEVRSTVAKSAYYKRLWASFFVKLHEKNPWSLVAVFWAYLKKLLVNFYNVFVMY